MLVVCIMCLIWSRPDPYHVSTTTMHDILFVLLETGHILGWVHGQRSQNAHVCHRSLHALVVYSTGSTATGPMHAVQMLRKARDLSSTPRATAAASRAARLCLKLLVSPVYTLHTHMSSDILAVYRPFAAQTCAALHPQPCVAMQQLLTPWRGDSISHCEGQLHHAFMQH